MMMDPLATVGWNMRQAEVDALKVENALLQGRLDHAIVLMNSQTTGSYFVLAENDQLKAENARLRAVVEAVRELMPFLPGPQAPHIPLANLRYALAALDKET